MWETFVLCLQESGQQHIAERLTGTVAARDAEGIGRDTAGTRRDTEGIGQKELDSTLNESTLKASDVTLR